MIGEEKPSVYLETSFISYLVSRPSRDLLVAGHQQVTQRWWESSREDYQLFISSVVIKESGFGDPVEQAKRMGVLEGLEVIPENPEAFELADALMRAGILPMKAVNDALHLAFAALSGIDYLLTWNCKHIANVLIEKRVSRFLTERGIEAPLLCTPLEIIGE